MIKQLIKGTVLYSVINKMRIQHWHRNQQKKEHLEWLANGKPVPPPHVVKEKCLLHYAEKYKLRTLVETGTYRGDMVEAMRKHFDEIYSIELSIELYKAAKRRFEPHKHIEIIQGDSKNKLKTIVNALKKPALFWLDGHYSGEKTAMGEQETPVLDEIKAIYSSQVSGHVILIDDARCFGTNLSYPSIKELSEYIKALCAKAEVFIENDVIRCVSA